MRRRPRQRLRQVAVELARAAAGHEQVPAPAAGQHVVARAPTSTSLPPPPVRVSFPLPPNKKALIVIAGSTLIVSFPLPPWMTMASIDPVQVVRCPLKITSNAPGVTVDGFTWIVSLPLVPLTTRTEPAASAGPSCEPI